MTAEMLFQEFDRQVQNLINKDYPKKLGFSDTNLREKLEPLKKLIQINDLPDTDFDSGTLPFVIVTRESLLEITKMIEAVDWHGRKGFEKLYPLSPTDFETIGNVEIPKSEFYLSLNIDRGKSNINLPPKEAMKMILADSRSPLTIAEGVALITHFPEFLLKNNCFSLLASRHEGDQRVPAIWISEKRPKLGWCWYGNPHTWLGSASCKERIG